MTFLDKADEAERQDTRKEVRKSLLNLALQGGGSHGAFAWGVLDRLLEEETLYFEGISGTSAGAANAVVLADGLAAGRSRRGKTGIAGILAKSVRSLVSRTLQTSPDRRREFRFRTENSPGFRFIEPMTHFASPYQLNPFNDNPFR